MGLPATATWPLTRSTCCSRANRSMRAARRAGSAISGRSITTLSKSSCSWSSAPSWWLGRAARSSSAAASSPRTTRGSTAPSTTGRIGRRRGFSASIAARAASTPAGPARSALVSRIRSAQAIWSSNTSASGVSWSRLSSAARCAATAAGSGAKRPAATASASASAMTPSTVIRDRIAGQSNALSSGFGSARPEVSIRMWSGRWGIAISASIVGMKSSATVQQMQPLASSTMFSAGQLASAQDFRISPSTPTVPNSLTRIARRRPCGFCIRWRMSVVLPAPRKPVMTVTGILVRSDMGQLSIGGMRARLCLRKITGRSRQGTRPSGVAAKSPAPRRISGASSGVMRP